MTRKMMMAALASVALLLSLLAPAVASAQTCTYDAAVGPAGCNVVDYPDFEPMADEATDAEIIGVITLDALPAEVEVVEPAAAPDTGSDQIAFTGSESTVLGYVGTGLIAFGAVALGSRRKFFQGALE